MQPLREFDFEFDRVLAVVAHPDDMEYGASTAVAVWTDAGKEVAYVLVTRGEAGIDGIDPAVCGPLREQEQIAAGRCVGVETIEFLDHRDGIIEHTIELRRDVASAIRRHRPELVVTLNHEDTWFGTSWNSPDHRNTGRAVLDAVGDAGNRWIFPELDLEPWSGVKAVAIAGTANPTHAVPIETGLDRGVASLEAHAAYLQALGGEMADARTVLTEAARMHAPHFGGRLCCAFSVIGDV